MCYLTYSEYLVIVLTKNNLAISDPSLDSSCYQTIRFVNIYLSAAGGVEGRLEHDWRTRSITPALPPDVNIFFTLTMDVRVFYPSAYPHTIARLFTGNCKSTTEEN